MMKMEIIITLLLIQSLSSRPILSNCEKIGEDTFCIKCKTNYLLDENRRCISSITEGGAYCKNCIVCWYGSCSECEPDYDLIGTECKEPGCDQFTNCLKCDRQKCLKCNIGYFLHEKSCIKESTPILPTNELIIIIVCPLLFALITLTIILYCFFKYKKGKSTTVVPDSIVKAQHDNVKENLNDISNNNKVDESGILKLNPKNNHNESLIVQQMNISVNADPNTILSLGGLPSALHLSHVPKKEENNNSHSNTKRNIKGRSRFNPNGKKEMKCIFCNSKSIYVVLDCGCELCSKHYLEMIKTSMNKCPIHDKAIDNYYIKQKAKIKDTFIETIKVDETQCSKCNKEIGIITLDCECSSKVCSACFEELDSMVNYYHCPKCLGVVNK